MSKQGDQVSKPETPKRCGVCGSELELNRVFARPDSWVCVKAGCPAWRWDGEPAPKAEACPLPDKGKVMGCQKSDNPDLRKYLYHRPDCTEASPKAEAPPKPSYSALKFQMEETARLEALSLASPAPNRNWGPAYIRSLRRSRAARVGGTAPPAPVSKCACPQTPGPFPRTAHGEACHERPNRLTVDGPPAPVSKPHKCKNPSECYDCLRLPVSEPPILSPAQARYVALEAERDALKAQNADLAQELERLRDLIVQLKADAAYLFDAKTEFHTCTFPGDACEMCRIYRSIGPEIDAARAAREAGKS